MRQSADVLVLFLVLSVALLSPMASNLVLPAASDHANHTAFVVEAKLALDEGQLPLRVAPFANEGLRYPLFQFYSQTPYLAAALVYKFLLPHNPWLALKAVYLMALWTAGIFVFRTCRVLGVDRTVSSLTGVVYITAPYLLINIHARGAYTEVFAQLMLPVLAYTSARLVVLRRPADLVWASLTWLILATSHIITFLLTTLFFVVFVAGLFLIRRLRVRDAANLLTTCVLGWGLAAFQWFPAATTTPLRLRLGDVIDSAWLTPIGALLSFTSTPPEPIGGLNTPFLNPAIGLPILLAVGGLIYLRHHLGSRGRETWLVLGIFLLAAFAAWSPINFWNLLPKEFKVVQFPYRLLTYTMVFGAMLFAGFLTLYRRHLGTVAFVPCFVALLFASRPYLPELSRGSRSPESIVAAPEASYAADSYMYAGLVPQSPEVFRGLYESKLPLTSTDGWLRVGVPMEIARAYVERAVGGQLRVLGDADAHAAPGKPCTALSVTLDGAVVATKDSADGPVEWTIPTSSFLPFFRSATGRMSFESSCGFVPRDIDPRSADTRRLWIRIRELRFASLGEQSLSVEAARSHCRVVKADVVCELDADHATTAQLPVLFYPKLLRLSVNGRPVTYEPSYSGQTILTTVSIGAGHSRVVAHFGGSSIGNRASVLAAGLLIALVGWRRWTFPTERSKPSGSDA